MADTKISALASTASVTDADLVPVVQSATTKKSPLSQLFTYVAGKLAPVLSVDNSASGAATGIKATSAAAGGGVALAVTSTAANENLHLGAKGTGGVGALNMFSTPQTLTDAATIAWNVALGNNARVTLGGNRTLDLPTNIKDGGVYLLEVTQDATGGRGLASASGVAMAGTLGIAANQVSLISFFSNGSSLRGVIQAF